MMPREEHPSRIPSLQALPSVDRALRLPGVEALAGRYGRSHVTGEVKALLAERRACLLRGDASRPESVSDEGFVEQLRQRIERRVAPALRPVFNLTGTVLHTNLGRALLCDAAVAALVRAARSPVNLEFDVRDGGRGDRDAIVESLLCEITGAEAATVVNNNAAAVLLTVAALAARREAIVSRGELVEIGGAFRMPDVMRSAGARLVEIGTTNRTHAHDYESAVSRRTGLILKVHTSNYVVKGFTASVSEAEISSIARRAGIPFAIDLGSGSLIDLAAYGLPREPLVQTAVACGADVVTFSGDKLLGGPQAGLIVGRAEALERIRRHPLKRALRVSKLVLAALEATLALYRHPERLAQSLPTLRLLTRTQAELAAVAERLVSPLQVAVGERFHVSASPVASQVGSGALPVDAIPSAAAFIRPRDARRTASRELSSLAARFRALPIPVVGRLSDDALVFDVRTLDDEPAFVAQLEEATR
ncbi:MAG TPA: L-seryl-tRNA(Sec) selenium transferase [Casimicrobiaceae bacterium]|nr:L-seryl-tRNA(Sec) selenium transferase [Casimicrobiaceae bacterium]